MMMLSPLLVAPFVSIAPLVPMSIAAITGIVGTIAPVVVISGDAVPSGPVIAVMSARSIMAATPAAPITMMLSHCDSRYRKCEQRRQLGNAACRERGWRYVSNSVVDVTL